MVPKCDNDKIDRVLFLMRHVPFTGRHTGYVAHLLLKQVPFLWEGWVNIALTSKIFIFQEDTPDSCFWVTTSSVRSKICTTGHQFFTSGDIKHRIGVTAGHRMTISSSVSMRLHHIFLRLSNALTSVMRMSSSRVSYVGASLSSSTIACTFESWTANPPCILVDSRWHVALKRGEWFSLKYSLITHYTRYL